MIEKRIIAETDRLVLRRFCKEDLQDLYDCLSNETVVWSEPYRPMDMNGVKDELDRRISTNTSRSIISNTLKMTCNEVIFRFCNLLIY